MKFHRYHALGNDYIVMDIAAFRTGIEPSMVERICHRHFGVGSDGILVHHPVMEDGTFSLRIMNPDGSEAEKSGNGLRIYARFLYDQGMVKGAPCKVATPGGVVTCHVKQGGRSVTVDMGRVSFHSDRIPVQGSQREVLNESLEVKGQQLTFCAATIGNPHCVVLDGGCSEEVAKTLGPILEHHPLFPNRTNVQFLEIVDRSAIRIEIWERGAGYTLASGSSSSAAAAVARRLRLVDDCIRVLMPGGELEIALSPDYDVRMTGPVTRIATGDIDPECLVS